MAARPEAPFGPISEYSAHNMRRAAVTFVLGVLVGAVFGGGAVLRYYTLDGIWGWFFSSLGDDTEYAPGYSDHGFRRIRIGMTEQEVLSLVGPPLARGPMRGTNQTWVWSRSPSDGNYRVRTVIFENERVSKVNHGFHLD